MDSIVCLCKGVKKYDIIHEIINGSHTVEKVKEKLGVTNGICKGERCKSTIEYFIKEYKDYKPSQSEDIHSEVDFLVCYCKQIKKSEIIESINKGYDTTQKLKEKLNVTNGICIGERCKNNIEKIIENNKK